MLTFLQKTYSQIIEKLSIVSSKIPNTIITNIGIENCHRYHQYMKVKRMYTSHLYTREKDSIIIITVAIETKCMLGEVFG